MIFSVLVVVIISKLLEGIVISRIPFSFLVGFFFGDDSVEVLKGDLCVDDPSQTTGPQKKAAAGKFFDVVLEGERQSPWKQTAWLQKEVVVVMSFAEPDVGERMLEGPRSSERQT